MTPKGTTITTTQIDKAKVSCATNRNLSLAGNVKKGPLKYRQVHFVGVGRYTLINSLHVMVNVFIDEGAEYVLLLYMDIQVWSTFKDMFNYTNHTWLWYQRSVKISLWQMWVSV